MEKTPLIFITLLISTVLLMPGTTLAHCPLCTVGAGALAVLAASIGVSVAVIGVFIGAFALALGLWTSRIIRRKYVKYQDALITAVIFLGTIIPIMPFVDEYRSLSIFIAGDYGSLLNRTYVVNNFLLGVVVGAVLLFAAPVISRSVVKLRNGRLLPYQGLGIAFILLIIAALFFQFIL